MARRTQSASSRAKEGSENLPENLVEADKDKSAEKEAGKARNDQTVEQAFKSSHVPGPAGEDGHPGYFPDQYTEGAVVYGHFCTVKDGDHEGAYGVYVDNVASDDSGKPTIVLVRERNTGRFLTVKYEDLAPASGGDVGRGR
jgi:hypothetical protein